MPSPRIHPSRLILAVSVACASIVGLSQMEPAHARKPKHRVSKAAPVYRISFYCQFCPDGGGKRVAWSRGSYGSRGVAMHGVRFGSRVRIDGYPQTFVVDDRGGGVRYGQIDVRRPGNRCRCSRYGVQYKRAVVKRGK